MSKVPLIMPPEPAADAAPAVKEKYRRDKEAFLIEGGKPITKATPEDTALATTTAQRLQMLRKAPASMLDLQSPMKAAIWLALLRPTKDVLFDAEMTRRFRMQQMAGTDGGEPAIAPGVPAIIALGNELVAAALSGDGSALRHVADRIEGTPGLRQGDADPEDPQRKKQTRDIVERVTRAMNAKRLEEPKDITDVPFSDVTPEEEKK